MTFSPDGLRSASASYDKTVHLWDGRTGHLITTLCRHSNLVTSLEFSSDGTTLLHIMTEQYDCGMVEEVDASPPSQATHAGWIPWQSRATAPYLLQPTITTYGGGIAERVVALPPSNTIVINGLHRPYFQQTAQDSLRDPVTTLSSRGTEKLVLSLAIPHLVDPWFSLDGSRLASTSYDNTVRFGDGRTSCHVATTKGFPLTHTHNIPEVCVSAL